MRCFMLLLLRDGPASEVTTENAFHAAIGMMAMGCFMPFLPSLMSVPGRAPASRCLAASGLSIWLKGAACSGSQ